MIVKVRRTGVVAFLALTLLSGCSSGSEVPDVVGEDVEFARGVLIGAGFEVTTEEEEHDGVAEGQVISQVPAGGETASQEDPVALVVAVPPVNTITGTFTLDQDYDDDLGGTSGNCYGTGGYDDIQFGVTVTVRDGAGTVLATGRLETGTEAASGLNDCVFPFEVKDVPKADFYSIEVGRRGELTYSHSEMEAQSWQVFFTLG